MGKKLVSLDIDEEVMKKFRIFCVNKTGKIKGVLSPEVEKALVEYLVRHDGDSVGR